VKEDEMMQGHRIKRGTGTWRGAKEQKVRTTGEPLKVPSEK